MAAWRRPTFWATVVGLFTALSVGAAVAVLADRWWMVVVPLLVIDAVLLAQLSVRPVFFKGAPPQLIPELVLLPLVVSVRQSTLAQIGILGLIALSALLRARNAHRSEGFGYLPAALLLLGVVITFRSGSYLATVLFFAVGLILLISSAVATRQAAYGSLLAGLSLYLTANVVGWMAGMQSPAAAMRIGGYETSSTLFGRRVLFPFTTSINEAPYVAAALIVAVVAMVQIRQPPRWYHWLGVAAGVLVLLASNSRTPLIMAVPVAGLLLVLPRATRAAAPYVVGAALLFPFLLHLVQPVARRVAEMTAANAYLSRGQDAEQILAAGGRGPIWSASITYWSDYVTAIPRIMFGYGVNGHAKSGATSFYARHVDFLADRNALTTHNSVLQALFDTGIVGALILFAVTVFVVYRYGRNAELLPMFAMVVMLGLTGTAEASLAPGLSHTPSFLLLYLAFFIPAKRQRVQRGLPAPVIHHVGVRR